MMRDGEGVSRRAHNPENAGAIPAPATNEIQGPCPHSRPDWRMCPHCLGLNEPLPEGIHVEWVDEGPGRSAMRFVDEAGQEVELPDRPGTVLTYTITEASDE